MTSKNASEGKEAAVAAYNSIVAAAELNDITLVFTNFIVKPEYYKVIRAGGKSADKLKRGFSYEFSAPSYDAERGLLGGQFDWSVEATFARRKLLQLRATYIVAYENVPDVGKTHVEAFVRRVGRFATYPYFRSLVSQLSSEARADLPVMPVLK